MLERIQQEIAAIPVSTYYASFTCYSPLTERLKAAIMFCQAHGIPTQGEHASNDLERYDHVLGMLEAKVIDYAAAYIRGASCGASLYQEARHKLHTWQAIHEGATYVNGYYVHVQ